MNIYFFLFNKTIGSKRIGIWWRIWTYYARFLFMIKHLKRGNWQLAINQARGSVRNRQLIRGLFDY